MRAAIYARVSTDEQNPEMQLTCLRSALDARGIDEFHVYQDTISSCERIRPQLEELMRDARAGKFDLVLVWKFDRFARSTQELLSALETFRSLRIDFISITEGIDTRTTLGRMVFTIIGAIAEFERSLIQERVKAGMESARARGRKIGRPRSPVEVDAILAMRQQKYSWREIGRRLNCSPATALNKAKVNLQTMVMSDGMGRK